MEKRAELAGEPAPRPCWSCGAVIGGADAYCKKCGKGQDSNVPWQYKHWGIVAITLLGLGPFSLIYVWRSPVLSRNARLAYTGAIVLLTWFVINTLYGLWSAFQSMLGGAQVY